MEAIHWMREAARRKSGCPEWGPIHIFGTFEEAELAGRLERSRIYLGQGSNLHC